jgi:uncharacterized Tic20 family protein
MFNLNNTNREYLGFIITYISYLIILLSIIYYGFFILNNINWGFIGTIVLIITGIIYPLLYYKTIKIEKENSNE